MKKEYRYFLEKKKIQEINFGIRPEKIPAESFDFQKPIISWALKKGRAAIFADCGLGKTLMQLAWADNIPGKVLILSPLAVANQTVSEGDKFGIKVRYARDKDDVRDGINITNYEMMDHFDPEIFQGVVLDESSILKSFDGKTREKIISRFRHTPYRLACTATPSPNDFMELGNHAEFLGVMSRAEMLSMFFVHDGGETHKWRLKGHAQERFWDFVCSWAVMLNKPGDLGFDSTGFQLPEIIFHENIINENKPTEGSLFAMPAATLQERISARRDSVDDRVAECARIVGENRLDQWIIWCNLNLESDKCTKAIPGSRQIKGSDSKESKEKNMMDFVNGKFKILITKPSIAGFGLNLQNCSNMAFVGLSDSFEEFYQATRRCWRFGQKRNVNAHIIISSTEGAVLANIKRKEAQAKEMSVKMVEKMRDLNSESLRGATKKNIMEYKTDVENGETWRMVLGDCVEEVGKIHADSVHYSIFSPPFSSLYTYSNSDRDMGNSKTHVEFEEHYKFLLSELYRVIMPGRLFSFHCMNLPTSKVNHGFIGIRDFRGELIRWSQDAGFIFHSEVCIWKDPVTAMQRTKALGLLYKQLKKDSCMSRQGIPDYLVTMRKPGENPERVKHTPDIPFAT